MTPQTQVADGRGRPQAHTALRDGFRAFVAGADARKMREDAYADEYAEVAFKGTQKAICLIYGGELHLPEGIIPVAPYDWVVELPDGTLGSMTAEQVADSMEFVSGPDDQRDAYQATVEYVENGRKAPGDNVPVVQGPGPELPHPDGGPAAQIEFDRRAGENLQADLLRQAENARAQLTKIAKTAQDRDVITKQEAADWVDSGVAPQGVVVRFEAGLGSYEVTRPPQPPVMSEGGAEAQVEGDAAA